MLSSCWVELVAGNVAKGCHHTPTVVFLVPCRAETEAPDTNRLHCSCHCRVEFLCHDISVHVPHHVSTKIPWYNLRKANESLHANWGEYMTSGTFNWRMMKSIFTECHVYDKEKNYKPFDWKKEEPLFAVQRKVLPDMA